MNSQQASKQTLRRRSTDRAGEVPANLGRGFTGEERSYGTFGDADDAPRPAADGMDVSDHQNTDAPAWPEWREDSYDEKVRKRALEDDPKSDYGRGAPTVERRKRGTR